MSLRVGDPAPPLRAAPVSGLPVHVAPGRTWVVAFVRGIGSAQARAWVRALQELLPDVERAGGAMVAVTPGPLDAARDAVPRWHVRFPVVVDPDGALRAEWGVAHADQPLWADLDADAARAHLRAWVEGRAPGVAPPSGRDADLLPAAFVVDATGRIAWAQPARRRWAPLDTRGLRDAATRTPVPPRSA